MHIAICDDNVADRHHLERLLGRESDKRKADTGVFYTDSYGQGSQLFPKRQSYDLIFIDLEDGTENGLEYALNLCAEGVTAPIVLYSSKVEYYKSTLKLSKYPENLLFLNKPVIKTELSDILDKAVILKANQVPTIELRHNTETYYVLEDDIVYATVCKEYINVYLKDGTEIPMRSTLSNFYSSISMYTHYALINNKTIINVVYLDKFSPFKVTLKSGLSFPNSRTGKQNITTALNYLKDEGGISS